MQNISFSRWWISFAFKWKMLWVKSCVEKLLGLKGNFFSCSKIIASNSGVTILWGTESHSMLSAPFVFFFPVLTRHHIWMDSVMHLFWMMWFPKWVQVSSKRVLKEVQSVPLRGKRHEWKWWWCVQVLTCIKKPSGIKSQVLLPYTRGCRPNYRVQKGSHPLCFLQPTMLDGSVLSRQEEVWFSQSRSSRLWPVLCCRGQITRSCQSPADTQRQDEKGGKKHSND